MNNIIIKKAKITSDGEDFKKIQIDYDEMNATTQRYDSKSICSNELPLPELFNAFKSLIPAVIFCGELPTDWTGKITPTGVSYVHEAGTGHARVVCIAKRASSFGAPLNINTPIRHITSEEGENDMPTAHAILFEKLDTEVERYINGDRAQQNLELEGKEEK